MTPMDTTTTTTPPPATDKLGRTFNPAKHQHRNGVPTVNKFGLFMPRGGRRPKAAITPEPTAAAAAPGTSAPAAPPAPAPAAGSTSPGSSPAPAQAPAQAPAGVVNFADFDKAAAQPGNLTAPGSAAPMPDEYQVAAAGTVALISTGAILAMGAHVKPDDAQTAAMVDAYAACYRHYGYKPEAPPWLAPAVVTFTWLGPHFADPRSQTTLQKWKAKLVGFWLWFRGKIDGRAATFASADAQRQAA